MRARLGWFAAALALALGAGAAPAAAQSPAMRLDSARARIRLGEYDSALAWLDPVFRDERTTVEERGEAFLLRAAAQFMNEGMTLSPTVRSLLEQSLIADSTAEVDAELAADVPYLADHMEALKREMYPPAAAVAAAPVVAPLTVQPAMLSDTVLPAAGARYPVAPHPSRSARAFVSVVRADAPGFVIWADTLPPDSGQPLVWNLLDREGAVVAPGFYAVQVWAVEPTSGERSPTVERTLAISRILPDTQPLPGLPTRAELRPESTVVKRGPARSLVIGIGLGVVAAALPTALGRTELNSGLAGDGTAFAAAGTVALAGVVGFLAGKQVRQHPDNVTWNADLRRAREQARLRVGLANEEARRNAPIRVRLEGAAP